MSQDIMGGFFHPKTVAVVGASSTPGKVGYTIMMNLINGKYKGIIYPINPRKRAILGRKAYKALKEVPGSIDMAIIVVPANLVPQVVIDCGEKGIKRIVIVTSGFGEVGNTELENQIIEYAKKFDIRILGPNVVGILSKTDQFNASFAPFIFPLPGKASMVSQSGALLVALGSESFHRRVGFDKLIALGNMADVSFADMIEWLDHDENTACISLYMEGLKDGRRFFEVCSKANKPIVVLKAGVSKHGVNAAASHTGSLAGAAKIYDAAFKQVGIQQAFDVDNLFDLTLAFSLQPRMKGDNLLIISNGGGVGVLATDSAEHYGLSLKYAPLDLQAELKNFVPEYGSVKNPIDLTGMVKAEWYANCVASSLRHAWVDGLVVIYCATAMTGTEEIARTILAAIRNSGIKDKPVAVSIIGSENGEMAINWLVENGIPAYADPDKAVNALASLRNYARFIETKNVVYPVWEKGEARGNAQKVIETVRDEGRKSLTEIEARKVFAAYDLPVANTVQAKTADEAVDAARKIGFPIVMKIVSPHILHKTDMGGVIVEIKTEKNVRDAFKTLVKRSKTYNPDACIHGVAVQEMAPEGTEFILGSIQDGTFGPTLMFGLGGIFVDIIKDVTFRIAPITKSQAWDMVDDIHGARILDGVRGRIPLDRDELVQIIVNYSNMVMDLMDDIIETDANPLLVYGEGGGALIVDTRIILK